MLWILSLSPTEVKRLTHEKLKEADDLLQAAAPVPQEQEEKAMKKAHSNLEKYNRMVAVTQNVLRVNAQFNSD